MTTTMKNPINVLLDSYEETGTDLKSLETFIKEMNARTSFVKVHSGDVEVLSYIDKGFSKGKDGIWNYKLIPEHLPATQPTKTLRSTLQFIANERMESAELLEEWTDRTKMAFFVNENEKVKGHKKLYLTSSNMLSTMDRFGMAGDFLLSPCFERDMMLAKSFEKDLGTTLVVRSVGKTRKIFSILSEKYAHINQTFLIDIVNELAKSGEMGVPVCHRWNATNFYTDLYVEFPDKAREFAELYKLSREMIPGVLLSTSDTGDASFRICGTWRIKGNTAVSLHSEVKRKHSGTVDIEQIKKDISETIFAEYAKIPEALCKLMMQDITDPAWDLTTSVGSKANIAEIDTTLKSAFKQLGIVKAIGKKTEKNLREALANEFNPGIHYTAYDVAMHLMALPERVSSMKKNIGTLQKACAKAPFVEYKVDNSVTLTV